MKKKNNDNRQNNDLDNINPKKLDSFIKDLGSKIKNSEEANKKLSKKDLKEIYKNNNETDKEFKTAYNSLVFDETSKIRKTKKKIYKEYRLRDINNFEKYFAWSLKEKTIKPIFDRYIKNRLEEKLKEHKVNISAEDYNINPLVVYHDIFKPNSPFHLYYNIRFKRIYEFIGAHIGETILSEFSFNEINNKPREIIKYFKMVIDLLIQEFFMGELNLLYLLEGNIEKMQELEQKLTRKSKPFDESYKRNMEFIAIILNKKVSKYKVVKDFCDSNKGRIRVSEKSLSNTFDKFLKNHKKEILESFELNENEFEKTFFPKVSIR